MSDFICVEASPATCGDPQTGSSRVKIGGLGVCRVEVDTAGGLIIGPGSQNIFVEGYKVSLNLDAITTHGLSPHAAARTLAGQSVVNASTGFAAITGDSADAPSPNLITTSFSADKTYLACSGQGKYPPHSMAGAWHHCHSAGGGTYPGHPKPPTVTYSYTIKNDSSDVAQPFIVGFWRFLDNQAIPERAVLTIASQAFYPDVELYAQQAVGELQPGATYSGTFQYNEPYYANQIVYGFGVYPDIYNTTTEPDEDNSAPTITISMSNTCGGNTTSEPPWNGPL
jgi:hypothetical protein